MAVAFVGMQKRLLLNKTQAFALAMVAGSPDTDAWAGKQITLSATTAPNHAQTMAITRPAEVHKEEHKEEPPVTEPAQEESQEQPKPLCAQAGRS